MRRPKRLLAFALQAGLLFGMGTACAEHPLDFAPADTAKLSAGPAGRFEAVSTNEGPAVRVTSSNPERDGANRHRRERSLAPEQTQREPKILREDGRVLFGSVSED